MARFEGCSDILLDDDSATSSIDQPGACGFVNSVLPNRLTTHTLFHLGNEIFVE
jgi:hypothetical protein